MRIGRNYSIISVIIGIAFLAFGSVDNVYAVDYVLTASDPLSCTSLPLGGIWAAPTCTLFNSLTIDDGDTLTVTNGVILEFPTNANLINQGEITNFGTITIVGTSSNNGQLRNEDNANFTNSGTITIDGTSNRSGWLFNQDSATFTNSGTITLDGINNRSGRLQNQETADFTNSGTITITGVNNNSGQLRNISPATLVNFGTITSTGGGGNSGSIRNLSTLTNSGQITTNNDFRNNNANSVLTNSGTITVTLNFNNAGGLVNNCGTITFGTFSGDPFVVISCGSSSSGSSTAYEDPTIGKSHDGRQMVEDGICIDEQCWTVTAAFHQDFELVEMLSDSTHTITTTVFCQSGIHKCNYVAYGVSPYGTNINHSVWKVILQKDHLDNWTMSIIDPDRYLGEVSSTTQIVNDNKHLAASATIEFKKPTPGMILNVEVRDSNGGYRDFKFNDGIAITDSYAYPEIDPSYDAPLEIESLCLNENPDKRYTCAFEKIREQTLIDAQIVYEDVINKKR